MNLKNNKEMVKYIKKIELVHVAIVLLFIVVVIFFGYQYKSSIPKKIEVDNEKIEKLSDSEYTVQNATSKVKKITCSIDKEKIPEEEFYNYISGTGKGKEKKGTGRRVNCSILVKSEDGYFKLKTLMEKEEDGKIYLVGCARNKYLDEKSEILLKY